MTREARMFSGVILITVPTIQYGGYFLLTSLMDKTSGLAGMGEGIRFGEPGPLRCQGVDVRGLGRTNGITFFQILQGATALESSTAGLKPFLC
jgi:hypothetical protein